MGNPQRSNSENTKQGFVYVLWNPALKRGLLKIGHTTKTAEKRAKQLYQTGVPDEFEVLYKMEFKDSKKAEKQVHLSLKKYRYNNKREFFTCSLRMAKKTINDADGKKNIQNSDSYLFEILLFAGVFILTLFFVLNT